MPISHPWSAPPEGDMAEATHRATCLQDVWPSAVSLPARWRAVSGEARVLHSVGVSAARRTPYRMFSAALEQRAGGVLCRPLHGALHTHGASRGVSDPQS